MAFQARTNPTADAMSSESSCSHILASDPDEEKLNHDDSTGAKNTFITNKQNPINKRLQRLQRLINKKIWSILGLQSNVVSGLFFYLAKEPKIHVCNE
jgi:hypothetical protein